MYETKNDIPEANRQKLVELLNARLADTIDLETQLKQAHWNVKGPHFYSLHALFDDAHDDVKEFADHIAERAVQLGGLAEGTARTVARKSGLAEYPVKALEGDKHVEAVASALAAYGKSVRAAIDLSDELRDLDTADLFTEVSRGIDKWLWMVEAHLQG